MESMNPNYNFPANKAIEKAKTLKGLTPRELIFYHMNNPDVPIRDEDIENLVLHTPTSTLDTKASVNTRVDAADNQMLSDNEIRQAKENTISTPYDILGDCD